MSYENEKYQERQREKEKKDFNEALKLNPVHLNDESYLFAHISDITLKLKQLPQKHHDNLLLITEYFKTARDSTNYKLIKPEILNNKLFLHLTMPKNPELYFFISPQNKNTFKKTAIFHDREFLKYLSSDDYDDPQIVKKITEQFPYFEKSLACITPDNFKKIKGGLRPAITRLDKKQCHYLKKNLQDYIENEKKECRYSFNTLIDKNPYLYTILDKDKYREDKSQIIYSLRCYHDLFEYLPEDWKKDKDIIKEFITYDKNRYGYDYTKRTKVVSPHLIVNQLQEDDLLGKNFVGETMKKVIESYPDLDLRWRSNKVIMNMLFKERDSFEITTNYCRAIPDKNISSCLVEIIKKEPSKKLKDIGEKLEKLMLYHKIDKVLDEKSENVKKIKL